MKKFEERESVVLENQGQKIFSLFHRPQTPPPYRTVLICHGLAGHKTGKYRLYVMLSERLSKLGIASMRFDFRGSGDSEGDFSEASLSTETSDAVSVLNYLRTRKDIDSSSLGLFGRSVGGTVALMAAQESPSIKSLAVWAPLYDGEQWKKRWEDLQASAVNEEYRNEMMKINGQVPSRQFFNELFSLNIDEYMKHLTKVPLLHIHGAQDSIVTPKHADQYVLLRKEQDKITKFIRLTESDHDFSHTKEQQFALDETALWFFKTL